MRYSNLGTVKVLRMFAAFALAAMLCMGVLAGCAGGNDSAGQGSGNQETTQSSDQNAAQSAPENAVSVTVENSITGDTLASGSVELPEGATALDALQALPVEVTVEDSQYGAYVSAIDGVAGEGMQGWTFTVNGEMPPVSAGESVVEPGDAVVWSYIDMSE